MKKYGDQDLDALRERLMAELEERLSAFSLKAFFSELRLERGDLGRIVVVAPNDFVAERYRNSFYEHLAAALKKASFDSEELEGIVSRKSSCEHSVVIPRDEEIVPDTSRTVVEVEGNRRDIQAQMVEAKLSCGLNPKYTMESFIVGDGNRFAHAVSMAVTTSPGDTYNPLFLYGGVGLGKTHLMQAVGHRLIESGMMPNGYIAYETSETFCNEYIQAIQSNSIDGFRKKYRQAGALLIDDVHFFGGKEKLQEEFFHTFNELYQAGRQIVMTSDRPPAMLDNLQERLVSRFKSGVIADIKKPDLETRIAILKRLADNSELTIPYECLERMAERVTENIRELEGAFTKTVAMASVMGLPVTLAMVDEVLADFGGEKQGSRISVELIKKIVSEHFSIGIDELIGKRRLRRLVVPRQVAMYLCHEMTDETLQNIGAAFGGRDHTTVIHSFNKVQKEIEEKEEISDAVRMIRIKLKEAVGG